MLQAVLYVGACVFDDDVDGEWLHDEIKASTETIETQRIKPNLIECSIFILPCDNRIFHIVLQLSPALQ